MLGFSIDRCKCINTTTRLELETLSVDYQDLQWMEGAFAALANGNRLRMFQYLRSKELECNAVDGTCGFTGQCCNVNDLVAILEVTQATVSHHLKELSRAELVEAKRQGRFTYCSVNKSALERLEVFLCTGVLAPASPQAVRLPS